LLAHLKKKAAPSGKDREATDCLTGKSLGAARWDAREMGLLGSEVEFNDRKAFAISVVGVSLAFVFLNHTKCENLS
jgi:hypothetical protein